MDGHFNGTIQPLRIIVSCSGSLASARLHPSRHPVPARNRRSSLNRLIALQLPSAEDVEETVDNVGTASSTWQLGSAAPKLF